MEMNINKASESTKMIRVDISKSVELLGFPLIMFEKDGETLRFLLDTGASMNFIKKDVLNYFSKDTKKLPQKTQYYGIDNVCHGTYLYSFTFKLGNFNYCEVFNEMQNADALTFDMQNGPLEVHGILGSQFFIKYRACFNYNTMEMFITAPDNLN